jgi:hypothetical protein
LQRIIPPIHHISSFIYHRRRYIMPAIDSIVKQQDKIFSW